MGIWVDFHHIKEAIGFEQVLAHYGLTFKAQGRELSGCCPFHKDVRPSFHIHLDKRAFHCFGCQAKGNVLDFVAAIERVSVREAALKLQDWFNVNRGLTTSPVPQATSVASSPPTLKEELRGNRPLTFTLKGIDPGHPYLVGRGIRRDLAEYFGVGFFPGKGSMRGRVVIPIHNEGGELVAYAGRAIDDTEPRYKLPKDFHKGQVLFNLHRVRRDEECRRVFVVEGFFDCMRVVEAGFVHTVALMGNSLSDHQERLLEPFAEVVLMLDGDEAGRKAEADLLARLARNHFVRVVTVPDQPDVCSVDQLQALLAF